MSSSRFLKSVWWLGACVAGAASALEPGVGSGGTEGDGTRSDAIAAIAAPVEPAPASPQAKQRFQGVVLQYYSRPKMLTVKASSSTETQYLWVGDDCSITRADGTPGSSLDLVDGVRVAGTTDPGHTRALAIRVLGAKGKAPLSKKARRAARAASS